MNEYEYFMEDCRERGLWVDPEAGLPNGTGILTTSRVYSIPMNLEGSTSREEHRAIFHVFVNYSLVYRGQSLNDAKNEYCNCTLYKFEDGKKQ
jgi:hypothetical protein